METATDKTEVIDLGYQSYATDVHHVVSQVFGHLVTLAIPHVRSFHSDLYFDAEYLGKAMHGEAFTFYFAARSMGTHIGEDGPLIKSLGCAETYRIEVKCVRGKFTMYVTQL